MTATPDTIELHLPITEEGGNAVDLLAQQSGLTKQKIKQAMQNGAVWLSRGKKTRPLRRAKTNLLAQDTLHLYYNAMVLAEEPPAPVLIADEGDYSVWHKPYGLGFKGSGLRGQSPGFKGSEPLSIMVWGHFLAW